MIEDYSFGEGQEEPYQVSFADTVFGLLFFFFIMALVLVFQKPAVEEFHLQLDSLSANLEKEQLLSIKLKETVQRKEFHLRELEERVTESERSGNTARWEERIRDLSEKNSQLNTQATRLAGLLERASGKHRQEADLLNKKYAELSKRTERYRNTLRKVKAQVILLTGSVETDKKAKRSQKKGGQSATRDLVTEIATVEDEQVPAEEGTRAGEEGKDEPQNFRIELKRYPDDTFDVEITRGEEALYSGQSLTLGEVDAKIRETSDTRTSGLPGEGQTLALYLKTHPNVSYGEFLELAKRYQSLVDSTIVTDWE